MTLIGLDPWLALLGMLVALWCSGFSLYVMISTERQVRASQEAVFERLSRRLAEYGDQQRASGRPVH